MPTTYAKNLLYRALLPVAAPSPRGQTELALRGASLEDPRGWNKLLRRHHVLGASLLLASGGRTVQIDASTLRQPRHIAGPDTLYRVASITKIATAFVALKLCDEGAFRLDDPVAPLLPEGASFPALRGVTVRQLLCHTSGLRDLPACDRALQNGEPFASVLAQPDVRAGNPGESFRYCNFGFGLMGCVMEQVCEAPLEEIFRCCLFSPLGMRAALDASALAEANVMEIVRVLPYRKGSGLRVTPLGRRPLGDADPTRHFGHTAGSLYTDAPSLSRLLGVIARGGEYEGKQLLSAASAREMTRRQSSYGTLSPTLSYGLGLLIISDKRLSPGRILGHQGFAYGCADGAFYEEDTGRQVILLNGGASEARDGRLGLCNRDLLAWALRKEMNAWT